LSYFLNILKSLSKRFNIPYNPMPSFKEIVRAVVNSGNWICPNSICTRSAMPSW
jgi:hypothetical protein